MAVYNFLKRKLRKLLQELYFLLCPEERYRDDYLLVIRKTRELLEILKPVLPQASYDGAHRLAECGEWGVALDILCDVLYDHAIPISQDTLVRMRELKEIMGMEDNKCWEVLSELLIDE